MISRRFFYCLVFIVASLFCTKSLGQSITNVVVTNTSGEIPAAGFCSGQAIQISFSAQSFPANSTFAAELSDAAGNFGANPTLLATSTVSLINSNLPNVSGTSFKIRVRSAVGQMTYSSVSPSFTINVMPTLNVISNRNYCANTSASPINLVSPNPGTTFAWVSSANVGFGTAGSGNIAAFTVTNADSTSVVATVTVTPSRNGCQGTTQSFTVTVNPTPVVNAIANAVSCSGTPASAINFSGQIPGTTYHWNSSINIGFGSSGIGNIPAHTVVNFSNAPIAATITVTPTASGCVGSIRTFTRTVNPTPTLPVVRTPDVYCQLDSSLPLSATASGISTLNWFDSANNPLAATPLPNTNFAGDFYFSVSQTNTFNCTSGRAFILVVVNPKFIEGFDYQDIALTSPTHDYPNASQPNPQTGRNISDTNQVAITSKVAYYGLNSITLNPGFVAETGAVFKAQMIGCNE